MFSFTLQVKSDGYERTPSTRVFLCASSPDESGSHALDWTIENLVQGGDELVVFRGIDQEDLGRDFLVYLRTHSLKVELPSVEGEHDLVRDEARDLLQRIQGKCMGVEPDRKVSIGPIHHACVSANPLTYPRFPSDIHHRRVHCGQGHNDD